MKRGALRRVSRDFAALFGPDWTLVGSDLMRRSGDWVQIIAFNASRFDDRYQPMSSLEYLKLPGPFVGGLCLQELRSERGSSQRWVSLKEHERAISGVFEAMTRQFVPDIRAPLSTVAVEGCLNRMVDYWPHAYALCIMAAEAGLEESAQRFYGVFSRVVSDRPFDWVEERRVQLQACLALMKTPGQLHERLREVRLTKLAELPGTPLGSE